MVGQTSIPTDSGPPKLGLLTRPGTDRPTDKYKQETQSSTAKDPTLRPELRKLSPTSVSPPLEKSDPTKNLTPKERIQITVKSRLVFTAGRVVLPRTWPLYPAGSDRFRVSQPGISRVTQGR